MEGRGMSLTGPNIDIDRAANLLTMEGPGRMEKLLDHDLDGQPLSKPETVKIDWQKGMVFDGRKAHFQEAVNVTSSSRLLKTGWLDVYFEKPISFSDTGQRQPPSSAERLVCGNGVFVENRTIDDAGQQASYDRMWLQEPRHEQHDRRLSRRRAGQADQRPPRGQPGLCPARRAARRPPRQRSARPASARSNVRRIPTS